MEPRSDYAQLQLRFVDSVQRRYAVIRPIILIGDRTAAQRAEETQMHPETVRDLTRRFRQQGMLGLLPEPTAIVTPSRGKVVSEQVLEELARLKALYDGFGYRALARMLWHQTHERIDAKTGKKLWQQSPTPVPGELPLHAYHSHPQRYQGQVAAAPSTVSTVEIVRISGLGQLLDAEETGNGHAAPPARRHHAR